MINKVFKNQKFLSEYFETYFKTNKRFPQSIVLVGSDILTSYFFGIELARLSNCLEEKKEDCSCLNCKWTKEDKHPSIIKVTPIDFKEDNTKTVISVKQIEKITSMINETSDYHRFFIFSGAKINPYNEIEQKKIDEFKNAGLEIGTEDWYPLSLNRKIFQEESSNALLKSVEEAPDKVTFIFIAQNKEDIIETITSRSLVFIVPSNYEKTTTDFSEFFEDYPNGKIENLIEKTNDFIEKAENNNIDLVQALDYMQEYLLNLIKINPDLNDLILEDIKKIQNTKKQIKALVSSKYAIESMFISLSKEGRNL